MRHVPFASRPAAALILAATLFVGTAHAAPLPTANVAFAESVSAHGFVRYWKGFVNRTDRVVLVVGLVAATALFIITRGKWLK